MRVAALMRFRNEDVAELIRLGLRAETSGHAHFLDQLNSPSLIEGNATKRREGSDLFAPVVAGPVPHSLKEPGDIRTGSSGEPPHLFFLGQPLPGSAPLVLCFEIRDRLEADHLLCVRIEGKRT